MNDEKSVGKTAAALLGAALKRAARSQGLVELSGKAVAKPRYRYSARMEGGKQAYLKGLAIRMERYGFIRHYGISAGRARSGGVRTRSDGKSYRFRAHLYKKGMAAKPKIEKAIGQSQVVPFLAKLIPQIRGEEIVTRIKELMTND